MIMPVQPIIDDFGVFGRGIHAGNIDWTDVLHPLTAWF